MQAEDQQLVKCYNNPGKNGGLTKVVAVKMVRSGYILKEELMVFADKGRYGAWEREVKDDSKAFRLSNWKDEVAINEN